MTTNRQIIDQIRTTSIVTSERGSWKYQDAFRVATYQAREAADGRILWAWHSESAKYSIPQLRRAGITAPHHGGLHNRPVSRAEAVKQIGQARVRRLERAGWKFVAGEVPGWAFPPAGLHEAV